MPKLARVLADQIDAREKSDARPAPHHVLGQCASAPVEERDGEFHKVISLGGLSSKRLERVGAEHSLFHFLDLSNVAASCALVSATSLSLNVAS